MVDAERRPGTQSQISELIPGDAVYKKIFTQGDEMAKTAALFHPIKHERHREANTSLLLGVKLVSSGGINSRKRRLLTSFTY